MIDIHKNAERLIIIEQNLQQYGLAITKSPRAFYPEQLSDNIIPNNPIKNKNTEFLIMKYLNLSCFNIKAKKHPIKGQNILVSVPIYALLYSSGEVVFKNINEIKIPIIVIQVAYFRQLLILRLRERKYRSIGQRK